MSYIIEVCVDIFLSSWLVNNIFNLMIHFFVIYRM